MIGDLLHWEPEPIFQFQGAGSLDYWDGEPIAALTKDYSVELTTTAIDISTTALSLTYSQVVVYGSSEILLGGLSDRKVYIT